MTTPAPIPVGTRSHLQDLFDKLYESYSRDPMPVPVIDWTVDTGVGSAYLKVSGMTAMLVMTDLDGVSSEKTFNLVNDGNGNKPTMGDFKSWLEDSLSVFFGTGFTVDWAPQFADDVFTDSFQRADNPTDWGGAWVAGIFNDTNAIAFSVANNKGVITTLNLTSQGFSDLGPRIYPDHEQVVRATLNGGPSQVFAGLMQRSNDNDTFYRCELFGNPTSGPLSFRIIYYLPATAVIIGGVNVPGSGFGIPIWMKFRVEGSHLSIKAWVDGDDEPVGWLFEADDTNVVAADGTGLYAFGSDIGDNVEFDYYTDTVLNIPDRLSARSKSALALVEGYVNA